MDETQKNGGAYVERVQNKTFIVIGLKHLDRTNDNDILTLTKSANIIT